jgi:hypothetical protein
VNAPLGAMSNASAQEAVRMRAKETLNQIRK